MLRNIGNESIFKINTIETSRRYSRFLFGKTYFWNTWILTKNLRNFVQVCKCTFCFSQPTHSYLKTFDLKLLETSYFVLTHFIIFLMKHFYGIFLFSKITKNRYCHFQVCSNGAVTERSIPPNFGACCAILEKSIFYVEFLVPEAIAQICFVNKVFCKISKSTFFTEHLRWLLLWFISNTSIIVTWVSWFSGHKFKLEAENFIFHILQKMF